MEMFIAIVFPIKAHVVCTRRKVLYVIAIIWPVSILYGLPTVLFNRLTPLHTPPTIPDNPSLPPPPVARQHCVIVFPGSHSRHFLTFKVAESLLFYFLPMITQVALYSVVAKRLFASMEDLHSRFQVRPPSTESCSIPLNGVGAGGAGGGGGGEESTVGGGGRGGEATAGGGGGGRGGGGGEGRSRIWNGHGGSVTDRSNDRAAETIRARKGVVKMLVASVVIYIISYSPHQAHLLYDIFSPSPLPQSWSFFVFVMVMTHLNSAANPVLYAIFSQNFRRNFKRCLCYLFCPKYRQERWGNRQDSFLDSRGLSHRASTTKTVVTRV
ncbi:hypothetical protein ACOMHN_006921 [Nucella lapillus]